jgi:hypothetical protein
MRFSIEGIGEQLRDCLAAKLAGRQADVVDDQQFYRSARRAGIAVG